jgi:hypothetical protein
LCLSQLLEGGLTKRLSAPQITRYPVTLPRRRKCLVESVAEDLQLASHPIVFQLLALAQLGLGYRGRTNNDG